MYPKMLVMRNSVQQGLIWQAYWIENDVEERILTKNAKANGFHVEYQRVGYTEETCPGWRNTEEWKSNLAKSQTQNELEQLRTFYSRIAFLTSNHVEINNHACVTADVLGKELMKVDPDWWKKIPEDIATKEE